MKMHCRLGLALVAAIVFVAVSGCEKPVIGYKEGTPPAGGPQQNTHVPPGERNNAPSANSAGH